MHTRVHPHMHTHTPPPSRNEMCECEGLLGRGAENCPESDGGAKAAEPEDVRHLSSASCPGRTNRLIHGLGAPGETWGCGDGSVHQDGVGEPSVS